MKKTLISLFAAVGIGIVAVGLVADEYEERHETHERGHHGEQEGERAWRATRDRTAPLRITSTDYFRGQHHEIPDKMVTGNPDVVSFSRCQVCHRGAVQGDFDEHGVRIPGYGRWDD